MNQLPLELIYIVGSKVRGKSLYDYKQITNFILDLNINDPYIEIVNENEFKKTFYRIKLQSINGEMINIGIIMENYIELMDQQLNIQMETKRGIKMDYRIEKMVQQLNFHLELKNGGLM
jgi:hypothetical protein